MRYVSHRNDARVAYERVMSHTHRWIFLSIWGGMLGFPRFLPPASTTLLPPTSMLHEYVQIKIHIHTRAHIYIETQKSSLLPPALTTLLPPTSVSRKYVQTFVYTYIHTHIHTHVLDSCHLPWPHYSPQQVCHMNMYRHICICAHSHTYA